MSLTAVLHLILTYFSCFLYHCVFLLVTFLHFHLQKSPSNVGRWSPYRNPRLKRPALNPLWLKTSLCPHLAQTTPLVKDPLQMTLTSALNYWLSRTKKALFDNAVYNDWIICILTSLPNKVICLIFYFFFSFVFHRGWLCGAQDWFLLQTLLSVLWEWGNC